MSTYAIGDVQGCFSALQSLLETIDFDPAADRLWFAGDLVNRGPCSLEVLRFVRDLGEGARMVLGNHDLHLLAVASGVRPPRRKDTLNAILQAPDRDELFGWLRARPLLHHDPELGYTMVHAGLAPSWDLDTARARAGELEAVLRGPAQSEFFHHMYGDRPDLWSDQLTGWERLRCITNCFTRIRYCDAEGRIAAKEKGPPGTQADGLMPQYHGQPQRWSAPLDLIQFRMADATGLHPYPYLAPGRCRVGKVSEHQWRGVLAYVGELLQNHGFHWSPPEPSQGEEYF